VFHDNDTLLGTVTDQLRAEEVSTRDRDEPSTRALGLMLHHARLCCRRTSQLVTILAEPASPSPISAWYRRTSAKRTLFRPYATPGASSGVCGASPHRGSFMG